MTPIIFYASQPHYVHHLAEVFHALERERPKFITRGTGAWNAARASGIDPQPYTSWPKHAATVVTAGRTDANNVPKRMNRVFLEHGAGQFYWVNDRPVLAGAPAQVNADLYLIPSERLLEAPVNVTGDRVVVGAPKLEWLRRHIQPRHVMPADSKSIGLAWHWNYRFAPETETAFPHHQKAIAALLREGWSFVGSGHPRAIDVYGNWYQSQGIRWRPSQAWLFGESHTIAADNTSVLWEACALDWPVLVLNSPRYRRTVSHGLRFWEYADVGPQVDGTVESWQAAMERVADPAYASRRREAAEYVYDDPDRPAAPRAAAAILDRFGD